jgi:hypothetical protein
MSNDDPINGKPPSAPPVPAPRAGSLHEFMRVCGFNDTEIAEVVALKLTMPDVLTTAISRVAMRCAEAEARIMHLEQWATEVSGGGKKREDLPAIIVPGGRGWRN